MKQKILVTAFVIASISLSSYADPSLTLCSGDTQLSIEIVNASANHTSFTFNTHPNFGNWPSVPTEDLTNQVPQVVTKFQSDEKVKGSITVINDTDNKQYCEFKYDKGKVPEFTNRWYCQNSKPTCYGGMTATSNGIGTNTPHYTFKTT